MEKEFGPGTVARTNRSNERFVLDAYVKAELVQETDSGKVYRATHLVMGGGEFDSPWIYESDQKGKHYGREEDYLLSILGRNRKEY